MLLGSVVACTSVNLIVILSMGLCEPVRRVRFGDTTSCGHGLRQRQHHECVADRRGACGPDVAVLGLEPS